MPTTGKPSMRDVAARCGVSAKTVSRILAGKGHLHQADTVRLVKAAAVEMGYRRNLLAQGILQGRTQTVGVIMPNLHDPFFADMLRGIHDALSAQDHLPLVLVPTSSSHEEEDLHRLIDRRVDGIILHSFGASPGRSCLAAVRACGIPLVSVNAPLRGVPEVDVVATDDAAGARLAADHLLRRGHRRLACLTWGPSGKTENERGPMAIRARVFAAAVRAAGCACGVVAAAGSDGFLPAAREMLAAAERPSAVFATLDHAALDIYRAAYEAGLAIPADLSVVGFADLFFASRLAPPLTTVRQDPLRIGAEAVRILLQRMAGASSGKRGERLFLAPELVVRASTGSAADARGAGRFLPT